MEMKDKFIALLRATESQGIEEVISYLEKAGFFTAPASTSFHLNKEGGLMEHSMNVYNMAMALRPSIVVAKPEVSRPLWDRA